MPKETTDNSLMTLFISKQNTLSLL